MFFNILNIILLLVSVILIILSLLPLNIFELISKSQNYNLEYNIKKKYHFPIVKQFLIIRNNSIFKDEGVMNIDLESNSVSFNIKGNIIKLNLNEYDKIVPIISII